MRIGDLYKIKREESKTERNVFKIVPRQEKLCEFKRQKKWSDFWR